MPGARCTRGLVRKIVRRNAHEHTGSAETLRHPPRNGFTAYAVLSPATNSSCHRRQRIDGFAEPGRARKTSADLAPATGVRTTRFCRTRIAPFVLRAVVHSRKPPCEQIARRRCRVHHIPSRVRDDRDTPLLPGKDGASW
jgi:hypothetical protein